jgi:hypothetical protein
MPIGAALKGAVAGCGDDATPLPGSSGGAAGSCSGRLGPAFDLGWIMSAERVIVAMLDPCWADLVGAAGETASVADRDPAPRPDVSTDVSPDVRAVAGVELGADVVTVLDRFLAAGISRERFDAHLAARRIAVDGKRITDPATPAPPPTTVGC